MPSERRPRRSAGLRRTAVSLLAVTLLGAAIVAKAGDLLGDTNCDGKVNQLDFDALLAGLFGTDDGCPGLDVNGDGVVSAGDVVALLDVLPTSAPTATPDATPTATSVGPTTPSVNPTVTATATSTRSPSVTPPPTATATPSITITPGGPTLTASGTGTVTQTPTNTRRLTHTATATETPTATRTRTRTATETNTRTPADTSTPTRTRATRTETPTGSPPPAGTPRTPSVTSTPTGSPQASFTVTRTPTGDTPTPSRTGTDTRTPTVTKTSTVTNTPTSTRMASRTATATRTATLTRTATATPVPTNTRTPTPTPMPTSTRTPTRTMTLTPTRTITRTPTATVPRPVGPEITYFGIATADNHVVPSTDQIDGVPIFDFPTDFGFLIVVEGRPGTNGGSLASCGVMSGDMDNLQPPCADGSAAVQILADHDFGNGSPAVCDTEPPIGGVPAVASLMFDQTEMVINAIDDLACRFNTHPTSQTACTLNDLGVPAYVRGRDGDTVKSTQQYCSAPDVGAELAFKSGITRLKVQVEDVHGIVGNQAEIAIRVP